MGRWFGRKSAVPDARPYVPAWLQSTATEDGFARFLTFEVLADAAPATIGTLLGDASDGAIELEDDRAIGGYAAYGKSIAAAVDPLVSTFGIDLFDDGDLLRGPWSDATAFVTAEELGNSADNQVASRIQREQTSARDLPAALRLTYYDPARDYQSGEARALASEEPGAEEQRDLPVVLDANAAKGLAQTVLARAWAERDTLTLRLGPAWIGLEPGSRLQLELTPRQWTVTKCTIDGLVVLVELHPTTGGVTAVAADAGRVMAANDIIQGEVALALLDSALVLDDPTAKPAVLIAASTSSPGWRPKAVELTYGGQRIAAQTASRKAVMGTAVTELSGDAASTVDVTLLDPEQWLISCDDAALAEGANLALVGAELIQFGQADPIGAGQFRLSRLVRGIRGIEATAHSIGEQFLLIEAGALKPIALPPWAAGYDVTAVSGDQSATLRLPSKPVPAAIADPAGGTTTDSEARAAITQMLAAMREQGLLAS